MSSVEDGRSPPWRRKQLPYRAVDTFHLCYKKQSVYAANGTSRSLLSDKHINTVWAERTVVEC